MIPKKIRPAHGPEYGIQREICRFLRLRGWHIERLAGGSIRGGGVQSGLPDLLICHARWGVRFVEVKNEDKFGFTKAQKWKFPLLMKNGCGVWVLTEATEDQYQRLFTLPNLWDYLDLSQCPDSSTIDILLEELDDGA